MKLCLLAVVTSGAMFAATAVDFMTGQAARLVIGQVNFTQQDQGTPTQFVLGACSGLAYANNTLFVVDSNHIQATPGQNRVLIYHNLSSLVPPPTTEIPQGTRCPVCVGNQHIGSASLVVGQTNFSGDLPGQTQTGLYNPSAVASDGKIMVVADTDSNRVLIWKNIPTTNGAPADIVLGQDNFTSGKPGISNKSLRGPQGVWIQGTRLFVADTANSRVLVWNSIPTTNNQPADYVLGEPNFNTAPASTTLDLPATANNMFSPVSVTSDGQRLLVTDLGHTRVLIWNSIPTQTQQPADLAIGQPDLNSEIDNNAAALCKSSGTDSNGKPTYPVRCYGTLSLPRFALSDGTRLFIADGGNDRVLVYNTMPTHSGQPADVIIGQPNEFDDQVTDSTNTFDPNANVLRSIPGQRHGRADLARAGAQDIRVGIEGVRAVCDLIVKLIGLANNDICRLTDVGGHGVVHQDSIIPAVRDKEACSIRQGETREAERSVTAYRIRRFPVTVCPAGFAQSCRVVVNFRVQIGLANREVGRLLRLRGNRIPNQYPGVTKIGHQQSLTVGGNRNRGKHVVGSRGQIKRRGCRRGIEIRLAEHIIGGLIVGGRNTVPHQYARVGRICDEQART